jgi:hypothetical protein
MEKECKGNYFLFGLIVAIGIAAAGYFVSQTLYNAKVAINTAEAKGLAERRVTADQVNWEIPYSVNGKDSAAIPRLYALAEQHQKVIIGLLKEHGFGDDEIKSGTLNYRYTEYRDDNRLVVDQNHTLNGTISINSQQVNLVESVRPKINKLLTKGIHIENVEPSYSFTKLNEIKPEMLREATKNARIAANEFASNAGVKVGGIRSARQGSFFIRDAGEEFGDTAKIDKDVRVVTTITFYLTE